MASERIEKLKRALKERRPLRDEEIATAEELIALAEFLVREPDFAEHLADHPMVEELKEEAKPKPSAFGPLGFGGGGTGKGKGKGG